MLTALQNLDEQHRLLEILRRSNWRIYSVNGPDPAAIFLRSHTPGVVIAPYRALGSLSWKELLEEARQFSPAPRLVLTDRLTDEPMWAEVLNLGAFDVLAQPFRPHEVLRVVVSAWRSWLDAALIERRRVRTSGSAA